MKKLQKIMVGLICLLLVCALVVGCGGGSKKSDPVTLTDPTNPNPPSGSAKIVLELNAGEEFDALKALTLPATYKGFTFGANIEFDTNTKNYGGNTYTARIKLGGSDRETRGITFSAKAGDKLTVLAMSSSSTGTGRELMVAPVSGDGVSMGEVPTSSLERFEYNIPADGDYVIYSSKDGINIYYIQLYGVRPDEPATKYTLTVNAENGSVDKDPDAESYDAGTTVTLTATAAAGYKFSHWSGDLTGSENPTTITMNSNKTVTAVFVEETVTPVKYKLTVNIVGEGSVTRDPANESYEYDQGTVVTLTATPENGFKFNGWSGAASGTDATVTVTMDADKTMTAEFELLPRVPMPFSDNFDTAASNTFFTTAYKAMPDDSSIPFYKKTGGTVTVAGGQVTIASGRFTVGDKGTATADSVKPNGVFDLSIPYKISFKIVSIDGTDTTKEFQVYVDNNTTSSGNSYHKNNSVLYRKKGTELPVGETVTISSIYGTKASFIQLRTETGLTVTIDDLVIEYQ